MKGPPNFALLIGKPKHDGAEGEKDPGEGMKDSMDQTQAEDSAIKQLMAAISSRDLDSTKQALKDFIEVCYPSVADDHDDSEPAEPDGDDMEGEAEGDGGY